MGESLPVICPARDVTRRVGHQADAVSSGNAQVWDEKSANRCHHITSIDISVPLIGPRVASAYCFGLLRLRPCAVPIVALGLFGLRARGAGRPGRPGQPSEKNTNTSTSVIK